MDPLAAKFERFRRDGDVQALGDVFDAVAPRLLGIAMHLRGNPGDAEDALQQTFVLAMQRAGTFDATRRLEPWLAGLLTNVANNARRHANRRRTQPLPELPTDGVGPMDAAHRSELLGQLRTRIEGLPFEQRQALLLQLQHGLGAAEIAEALQVSPGTVRMRLHRGIRALQRALPVGLAVALSGLLPSRGLAAVRQSVMATGADLVAAPGMAVGAASGPVTVAGLLLMKKVLIAAVAALFLGFAWWSQQGPGDTAVLPATGADRSGAVSEVASTVEPVDRLVSPTVPESRKEAASGCGSLMIRVVGTVAGDGAADSESVPLAGARVQVWPGASPLAPFRRGVRLLATDAAGEAELSELNAGLWQVRLLAGVGDAHAVTVVAGEQNIVELVGGMRRSVSGVVVDATGLRVAGAEVWVHRGTSMGAYSRGEPRQLEVRRGATTDERGRFVVAVADRERMLGAAALGHGASFGQFVPGDDREVRLVLGREAGSLAGVVRDGQRQPTDAALVEVVPNGQDSHRAADGSLIAPRVPMQTYTDENGHFVFEGLPPGKTRYWASAEPNYPAWGEVEVVSFGRVEVDITLKPGITVVGSVRFADGSPARVAVHARPRLDKNGHFSHCDTREDGSYRIDWVPQREFVVTVSGRTRGFLAHRVFRPTEPGVLQCDFVLAETAMLTGRVLDPAGAPLSDWQVRATSEEGRRFYGKTDRDGSFAFMGPKLAVLQVAATPWHGDPRAPLVAIDGVTLASSPIVLQVDAQVMPAASVRGRLVDTNGVGVAKREIRLGFTGKARRGGQSATTGADGSFEFSRLSAAEFTVTFPSVGALRPPPAMVSTTAGEAIDLGDLAMPQSAALRVVVRRHDGSAWNGPLPTLVLRSLDGERVEYVSLPTPGDVLQLHAAAGHYEIEVGGRDLVSQRQMVDLVVGDSCEVQVRVAIGRSRQLIFNGDGLNKLGARDALRVTVRGAGGTSVLNRDDVCAMPDLRGFRYWSVQFVYPFGDYTVEAVSDAGIHYRGTFTVGEGLHEAVRIDVPHSLR